MARFFFPRPLDNLETILRLFDRGDHEPRTAQAVDRLLPSCVQLRENSSRSDRDDEGGASVVLRSHSSHVQSRWARTVEHSPRSDREHGGCASVEQFSRFARESDGAGCAVAALSSREGGECSATMTSTLRAGVGAAASGVTPFLDRDSCSCPW